MGERVRVLSVTLADCEVQTFRAGGKGGQNQNKRDTGVRIIHPPSGARGEARDERSQLQNKRLAFRRMVDSTAFRAWLRVALGRDLVRLCPDVAEEVLPVAQWDHHRVAEPQFASSIAHAGTFGVAVTIGRRLTLMCSVARRTALEPS